MPEQATSTSTHQFVDIDRVEEGVIVLKNKNLRSILMVSSVNFDLKSSDERSAIIGAFQQFLNSLDFPVQICIQSRPLDLTDYFAFLHEQQEKQSNELLRIQTTEYLSFVQELVQLSNIMSKFFYVVVPYDIAVVEKSSFFEKILPAKKDKKTEVVTGEQFQDAKEKLQLRVNHVFSLLGEMGLRAIPLGDRELVELFYGLYNPGVALKNKNFETLLATGMEEKQPE